MATGTILLPIGSALLPDGTTDNAAPGIVAVKSSASAPTPYFLQALFDASTEEMLFWSFRMPANYSSAPVLKLLWKMASATSGNVVMEAHLMAVTPGDSQDVDADGFATVNTSSATSVPGTAGHLKEISLTLSNADSVAAGDLVVLRVARDAGSGSDTASGDLERVAAALEYTVG